jgi:hypothetical protein
MDLKIEGRHAYFLTADDDSPRVQLGASLFLRVLQPVQDEASHPEIYRLFLLLREKAGSFWPAVLHLTVLRWKRQQKVFERYCPTNTARSQR